MKVYSDELAQLFLADSFSFLDTLPEQSVDLVFADPPYFLSDNGFSCSGGKMVSVNKGEWDRSLSVLDKHAFNKAWIRKCKRILKPTGSLLVSGTLHNIFSCGMALEEEGYSILNNITWRKLNPPPNLSCRYFVHSTENIIWATVDDGKKYFFNYELMKQRNGGKQMKDVIEGALTPKREKQFGKHPTQKPEYLLETLILATTQAGMLVLDPFCGSGTTCVVAKRLNRQSIGVDLSVEFLEIAKKRLQNTVEELNYEA